MDLSQDPLVNVVDYSFVGYLTCPGYDFKSWVFIISLNLKTSHDASISDSVLPLTKQNLNFRLFNRRHLEVSNYASK